MLSFYYEETIEDRYLSKEPVIDDLTKRVIIILGEDNSDDNSWSGSVVNKVERKH